MRSAGHDATSGLLRAVRASFAMPVALEEVRSRAWASATFMGARHELSLRVEGEQAEEAASSFVAGLGTAEFPLKGHIVADMHLASQERGTACGGEPFVRLRIEALTVEDC
jgi:hypothetical protein